jgi:hypothetical protein
MRVMDNLRQLSAAIHANAIASLIVLAVLLGALNELVNRMRWTAAESILQGGARAALLIPGVRYVPVLGTVLGWCAKADLPAPARADRALAIVLCLSTLAAGCACWNPRKAAYNSRGCVIARKVVDCTQGSVWSFVKVAGPMVVAAILSGNWKAVNLKELAARAEHEGVGWGTCLLAAVDADLGNVASGSVDLAAVAGVRRALLEHARSVYGDGPIEIKVPTAGGEAVAGISLP